MKIRRISFFGGPNSGKSRNAAWLYSELKERGVHCELVTEWVKKLAHQKTELHEWSQLQIFTEQLLSEYHLLASDPDIVLVSDSPLCLSWMYATHNNSPYAAHLYKIWSIFQKSQPNELLICLNTPPGHPYNPKGRYQTEAQAAALHEEFLGYLHLDKIPYSTFVTTDKPAILSFALSRLEL